jgi:hypothetical protein
MQSASSSFRVIDDDDSDIETYSNASINARNRRRQEQLNASEFTVFIENFEVDINSSPINQVIIFTKGSSINDVTVYAPVITNVTMERAKSKFF